MGEEPEVSGCRPQCVRQATIQISEHISACQSEASPAAHTAAVALVVYRHVQAVAGELFVFHVAVLACPQSGKLVAVALDRIPRSGYFNVPSHAMASELAKDQLANHCTSYFVYLQPAKL